jgi:hypothetical protein
MVGAVGVDEEGKSVPDTVQFTTKEVSRNSADSVGATYQLTALATTHDHNMCNDITDLAPTKDALDRPRISPKKLSAPYYAIGTV